MAFRKRGHILHMSIKVVPQVDCLSLKHIQGQAFLFDEAFPFNFKKENCHG